MKFGITWTKRVPSDEVLKRVDEKNDTDWNHKTCAFVKSTSNVVGHLLHYADWFTTLTGGLSEKRRPKQEYMHGVKEGRRYVVIVCLRKGENCNPTNL